MIEDANHQGTSQRDEPTIAEQCQQNAPVAGATVEAQSSPPNADKDVAYSERNYILERKKYRAEKLTLLALLIYTAIAGYQAWKTREAIQSSDDSFKKTLAQMQAQTHAQQVTANSASQSADNAKKSLDFLRASQGAFLQCRIETPFADPSEPTTMVTCINNGKTPAKSVTATLIYKRSDASGKVRQNDSRNISRPSIVPTDAIQVIFPVSIPVDYAEWQRETFTVTASTTYDNGVERITQGYCWGLAASAKIKGFRWVNCEDVKAVKEYPFR